MELRELAKTATTITLGWTPPANIIGYEFILNGKRLSNTWDPTRSQVTFAIPSTPNPVYEVTALAIADQGTYPPPAPSGTYDDGAYEYQP